MMVAQSPKLARFFKQTPMNSSQKSLSLASQKQLPSNPFAETPKKIAFTGGKVNEDYFGQQEVGVRVPLTSQSNKN